MKYPGVVNLTMIDLREYIISQREKIRTYASEDFIPESIRDHETFMNIAMELQKRFVHDHRGKIGGRDHAHNVRAMAIICSLWCGWLSQAKANRSKYTQEWVDSFKKAIVDAFEVGQKYSRIQK